MEEAMKITKKLKNLDSPNITKLKVCLEKLLIKLQDEELPLFEESSLINYYELNIHDLPLTFCLDYYSLIQHGDINQYNMIYSRLAPNVRELRDSIIKYRRKLPDDMLFDYRNILYFGIRFCETAQFLMDWIMYVFLKQHSSYTRTMLTEQSFLDELISTLHHTSCDSIKSNHISLLLLFLNSFLNSEYIQDGGVICPQK